MLVQRDYAMVAESAYGAQAQADFGEYNLRNSQGRHHHPLRYKIVDTATLTCICEPGRYSSYGGV